MTTQHHSRSGRPPGGGGSARQLSTQEIEWLRSGCGARERAFLWLGLGAGLRVGEICGLRYGMLDSDQSIRIPRVLAKSKRSRRVCLSAEAKQYLQQWLSLAPLMDARSPIFASRVGGGCMTPSSGSRWVKQLFARCGIVGATSHSLRRTHANLLRVQNGDLLVIKSQLGHASIQTTEEYLALMPAEQDSQVDALKL